MVTFYGDIHKILECSQCMALLRGALRLYTLWIEQLGETVILIFDHKMEIKDWLKKQLERVTLVISITVAIIAKIPGNWVYSTFVFRDLYSELEIIVVFMPVAVVNPLQSSLIYFLIPTRTGSFKSSLLFPNHVIRSAGKIWLHKHLARTLCTMF